jgi:hypothetical protein
MTPTPREWAVFRRYVYTKTDGRGAWSQWFPIMKITDIRTRPSDGSAKATLRNLISDHEEKFCRAWTDEIRAGRRPLGPSFKFKKVTP